MQYIKPKCGILYNALENDFYPYLNWLIKEGHSKNFEISGILTNDIEVAKKHFTNLIFFNSLEQLIEDCDIIFSFGYWRLIDKELINKVPLGIINFHHSYKLKYKTYNHNNYLIN